MSILLSVTFVLFLVDLRSYRIVSLLSIIRFGTDEKSLITLLPKYRAALFSSLILEVVGVVVGAGYLAVDKLDDAAEKLARATIEKRQPSTLHDFVLLQRDITRVRILGINALGVLHKYRRDLVGVLLREQAVVQILLLNPDSGIFLDRRNLEETAPQQSTARHSQFVSGRIRAEWEASRAVLRDIVNQLVNQHSKDIKETLGASTDQEASLRAQIFIPVRRHQRRRAVSDLQRVPTGGTGPRHLGRKQPRLPWRRALSESPGAFQVPVGSQRHERDPA